MLRKRIIPCLQLINNSLVKSVKFGKYKYIGDPINTVRIFNELEVDELCFLDIRASIENRLPNFELLHQIAEECFMPLSYGGGIKDINTAQKILSIGFEKVVINTATFNNLALVETISNTFGSQSLICSVDVRKSIWGKYEIFSSSGRKKESIDLIQWIQKLEEKGAGEILLTSINREGTWSGFDLDLIHKVVPAVNVPIIANGGCGSIKHIQEVLVTTNTSAVALGSMVVYQKKDMGVLVNFPDKAQLNQILQ